MVKRGLLIDLRFLIDHKWSVLELPRLVSRVTFSLAFSWHPPGRLHYI